MKVKIWGARGSLPASLTSEQVEAKLITALRGAQGIDLSSDSAVQEYIASLPPLVRGTVGSNTPCVSVQIGEEVIILDAGSGLRSLGIELMKREFGQGQGTAHIFISHTHWDHIQGLPFFRPALKSGNRIIFYSPIADLVDRLAGQQRPEYFPLALDKMPADIQFITLEENQAITVAGARVSNILQAHPGRAYGYRIESDDAVLVYATDAEYKDLGEAFTRRYTEFMMGADLLIFDAQYTLSDSFKFKDWGHSSSFIGFDIATRANVRRIALFHLDHTYTDAQIQKIWDATLEYAASDPDHPQCEIWMGMEGLEFDLGQSQRISIEHHRLRDAVVLTLSGRFDADAVELVHERLTALISDQPRLGLVIDLSQVTHLSVAGLKTLINAKNMGQGLPIVLAAAPENVRNVLAQVGFAEEFVHYDSVKDALAALEAREFLELEGHLLHRRYRIDAGLDMSQKAALFKAFDTWFERPVTVKVLSWTLGDQVEQLLLREARAVAHLNHPNIAQVYDCVEYRNRLFLIREFVPGLTLRHWLDHVPTGSLFPPDQTLSIVRDVLRGLAYAHDRGVIHCTLRPENVILAEQGAKIINFGLGGRENWSLSDLRYIAPEQISHTEATPRSDLYASGVILYEMVTGRLPFNADTVESLTQMRMRLDPVPPRQVNPRLPLPLERIMMTLLNRNPLHRYPSAEMALDALSSISAWQNK